MWIGSEAGNDLPAARRRVEWLKCSRDVVYFTRRYVHIYDATRQAWLPFALWSAQEEALRRMANERLLVVLKARQLGLSWLCLAYALWVLLYQAPATVLLFSLRETEAVELLLRMQEMHDRLPAWMQAHQAVNRATRLWRLSNGSRGLAFSTTAGRAYTGTLAIVDEADYVPDLGRFLNGVKPTIDAGGKLFLVSTADKRRPRSVFKNLFRSAEQGTGDYRAVFLPWWARPERDAAWYARTRAEMEAQRGTPDDFYAEYPATPAEALAPEESDRRLAWRWVEAVLEPLPPLLHHNGPALPGQAGNGLAVYVAPQAGRRYVIGADPAEGNPSGDDSAACVVEAASWAEVATLVGKLEPGRFAAALAALAAWYHDADILVERNNHGHSVIHALQATGTARVLPGIDGKPGWLSNVKGKALLYDVAAEAVRDGVCRIRNPQTAAQLASIQASTLRAPTGLADDRADAFALALAALVHGRGRGEASSVARAPDPLVALDRPGW